MSLIVLALAAATPQAAAEAELAKSAAAWDRGDLAGFVAVYAADAIYVSGTEVARGRDAIAARYAKSFVAGANTRGRLTFQPVAHRALSAVHLLYVARWTLTPREGTPQTGTTTLLFERRREGWRIISDHSS